MSKHSISRASELYFGDAYDPTLFGANQRAGVQITPVLKASLGSPIALSAGDIIAAATSTELPNIATKTYTAATNGTSPTDSASVPVATTIAVGDANVLVWPLDVARNVTAAASHATSVVAMSITITGYDKYLQKMVETLAIAATGTSQTAAGKKAFKYISSIAITSAGNATTNTLNMGWGDAIGLPYRLADKSSLMQTWFNDVLEATVPTIVLADATTPSATTGDVRGTIDLASASNGSAVEVYIVPDPTSRSTLLGIDNFGG